MPAIPVDLTVTARWLLPMTYTTALLENQTVVIRDGRIIDILPDADATTRYAAAVHVERRQHLLLPGLIDAAAQVTSAAVRDRPERTRADTLLGIAELLRGGTTCFCTCGDHPDETARAVAEQGLRAVIGIPLADAASTWARTPGEYLTRALDFRDQYRGHPRISTAFAPRSPCAISDATFARIATLADELDAGIVIPLHESPAEIVECFRAYGMRPLERLQALGLVSPALTGMHMSAVDPVDLAIAKRGGMAVTLCPQADLLHGRRPRPLAAWTAAGLRLSVGSDAGTGPAGADLWNAMRQLALWAGDDGVDGASERAMAALTAATRGGAATLGLEAEIGTLETGKWADLCCVDLRGPALARAARRLPRDPAAQVVFNGGRELVSDVWVGGAQLLRDGLFTRLDWPRSDPGTGTPAASTLLRREH